MKEQNIDGNSILCGLRLNTEQDSIPYQRHNLMANLSTMFAGSRQETTELLRNGCKFPGITQLRIYFIQKYLQNSSYHWGTKHRTLAEHVWFLKEGLRFHSNWTIVFFLNFSHLLTFPRLWATSSAIWNISAHLYLSKSHKFTKAQF